MKFKELLLKSKSFLPQELQERLIVLSKNIYFLILLNVIFAFMFVVVVNLSFVDAHSVYLEEYQDPYIVTNVIFGFIYGFFELVFIGSFYVSIVKIALYLYTFFKIELYTHGVLLNINEAIRNILMPFHMGNLFILIVICEIVINLFKIRLWTIFALIRIASVIVFFKYL